MLDDYVYFSRPVVDANVMHERNTTERDALASITDTITETREWNCVEIKTCFHILC